MCSRHTVAERTRCEVVSISHRQVVRTASPGRVYLKELLTDFYCGYRSRLHEATDYTHTGMLQQYLEFPNSEMFLW